MRMFCKQHEQTGDRVLNATGLLGLAWLSGWRSSAGTSLRRAALHDRRVQLRRPRDRRLGPAHAAQHPRQILQPGAGSEPALQVRLQWHLLRASCWWRKYTCSSGKQSSKAWNSPDTENGDFSPQGLFFFFFLVNRCMSFSLTGTERAPCKDGVSGFMCAVTWGLSETLLTQEGLPQWPEILLLWIQAFGSKDIAPS